MPTSLSAVRCRLPCPSSVTKCLLPVPFSNSLLAFPYPLPVTPRSRVQNPLSGFAPKQTKESSAWRTSYIVLHKILSLKCNNLLVIGLAVRVCANGPGDLGSIKGRVIPKTQKMVLDASLLNTQHCKVRIKGKVEQARERSSALPYTLV